MGRLEVYTLFLRLGECLPHHLLVLCAPRRDLTLEGDGDGEEAWDHLLRWLDQLAVGTFLFGNVESPQDARDVDKERALCEVDAWADASPCAVGEVVAFVGVGGVDVVGGALRLVEVS